MFNTIKKDPIYKHTHLDKAAIDRVKPLMESAFSNELKAYTGNRSSIGAERLEFAASQFANRMRVSGLTGAKPLNEDAKIFGVLGDNLKSLFESVSTPGNVIGMGNVRNAMNATDVAGGMWNPGYKPGTGDIPSYVFGLQSHIALHCIGFDLIPTIAVDTPKPMITYVDTVYGGGALDNTEDLPSYIELESPLFTRAWITNSNLLRAKTELVITDKNNNALRVRFMLGSTITSSLTVEVLAIGKTTTPPSGSTPGTYTWDNGTASVKEIVENVSTGNAATIEIDFGNTSITTATTESLFVNYASATRTNIGEAASNNNSLGGMSRAQHEKGPKHKLNVITLDKQLDMVGIEIEADTSNIQIKDMAAMGVNVISYLYTGVQNQIVQTLDEIILDHLYKLGVKNAVGTYLSQGINHSLYISSPANTNFNFANSKIEFKDPLGNDRKAEMGNIPNVLVSSSYENQITHNDRFYRRILIVSEFIEQQTRIAPADTIVLGGELASAVKAQSTFTVCPVPTTIANQPGIQYYGTIYGTINVYKNPKIDFNDPRVLIFRRGDDKDPGAKFLAYDLAASRQIIAEQTMAEKIRVWSRFSIADVGFYPELNYYTMVAINDFKFA